MIHASLFSGIGGFDIAAEWMGWENAFHCEWNSFCQTILKHYWPNATSYEDITKTDFSLWRERIDVLTGGFPCQPYSVAGKQLGTEDERHLWPEMLRAIREIKPTWVVGENVRGLVNWSGGLVFEQVQADLEAEGYEVLPFLLPAAGVGAPHRRDRIWFIAYRSDTRNETVCGQKISTDRSESSSNSYNDDGRSYNCNRKKEKKHILGGTSRFSKEQFVTNTCGKRRNHRCNYRQKRHFQSYQRITSKNKSKWKRWKCRTCEIGTIITHTCSTKLERIRETGDFGRQRTDRQEWKRVKSSTDIQPVWRNFPTQSPVCYGDDGFSTESLRQRIREDSLGYLSEKEIDKILSKAATDWRNESIKAGGNAIVPQLALQIFKAINEYEKIK